METYKYKLDRSSKKFLCPNCNKKTFVKFIEAETGSYLTDDFGRCDREQNCNYFKSPPVGKKYYLIEVLSLKDISDKATKIVDKNGFIAIVPKSQILEQSINECWISEWFLKSSKIQYITNEFRYYYDTIKGIVNEVKKSIQLPDIVQSFHSLELLDKMYCNEQQIDNFTEYLNRYFTKDEVFIAKQNYFITGTNYFWNNSTIFWRIDNLERIHSGKIINYDRYTGKRIKEPYNRINWVHKAVNQNDININKCLFGLHRINEDYQKTIAIVESEKTAVIMSILLPQYIWIATGGKGMFKHEMLKPLKKRIIISFPDKGEYINWLNTATELTGFGFKISVSDILEQTEFENGFDLADYYLRSFDYL